MIIVRYCNNRGQLVDQIVIESTAYETYLDIKKQFGQADLILIKHGKEYCLM